MAQNGCDSPFWFHFVVVHPIKCQRFFVAATVIFPFVFPLGTYVIAVVTPPRLHSFDHIDESSVLISPFAHFCDILFWERYVCVRCAGSWHVATFVLLTFAVATLLLTRPSMSFFLFAFFDRWTSFLVITDRGTCDINAGILGFCFCQPCVCQCESFLKRLLKEFVVT